MWRKCICRGKKTPKAFIGWVTIAYCMSLKVHGNILFIVHKATRSSWDSIPRDKVKDISALKQWFWRNTTLLMQFFVTDSWTLFCVCHLASYKWVWSRLNVLLSVLLCSVHSGVNAVRNTTGKFKFEPWTLSILCLMRPDLQAFAWLRSTQHQILSKHVFRLFL